jgi:Holliday junction resolvasome RuvABC DNA-binding subunit
LRQQKSTAAPNAHRVTSMTTTLPNDLGATRPVPTMWGGLWTTPATATYEKVRSALRGLGFRDAQARRAVAAVARRHDSSEDPPLEQVLREAIHVAAAA